MKSYTAPKSAAKINVREAKAKIPYPTNSKTSKIGSPIAGIHCTGQSEATMRVAPKKALDLGSKPLIFLFVAINRLGLPGKADASSMLP